MNYRRARFQPKIFSDDEKNRRLEFALNLKNMINSKPDFINHLMLTDETQLKTGVLGIYHNRVPSSRPKVAGFKPRSCKNLNVWAGITCNGPTKAVVIFYQ